jgi:hypothetical protein
MTLTMPRFHNFVGMPVVEAVKGLEQLGYKTVVMYPGVMVTMQIDPTRAKVFEKDDVVTSVEAG